MKKIKSVHIYSSEEGISDQQLKRKEVRDEEGHVLLEEQFHPDGSLESRVERAFDGEGRLLVQKEFSAEGQSADQEIHYFYSAAGRLDKAEIRYMDGSITLRQHSHDEAANSEAISIVNEAGVKEGSEFRRYDSEGRILEEVLHGEEEELEHDITNEYDEHGYLLKRVSKFPDDYTTIENFDYERNGEGLITYREIYDEDEEVLRADEFEYDERKNNIQHKAEDFRQGWAIVDQWEYDEKDRIIKSRRYQGNATLLQEISMTYNEEGLVIERENRSSQGVMVNTYQYEYF